MTDPAYDSILPPLPEEPRSSDLLFDADDLSLIRRLLTFADAQVPIEDQLGSKIYPTEETRKRALAMEERLDNEGVTVVPGHYVAFDPFSARDRIGTIHYFDGGYEHIIKGLITSVEQTDTGSWEVRLGTSVAVFDTVEDFKANVRVELDVE
jgi:hypothetical protein